ncbi:phosphatidylinositol N-acetylglucosaminyltransferase subunit P-like isoform X1 [Salvia splendens]|uniref:phosphatidylinositol N-acetylglucosaminyltransferase subunit P-like isoform X1 n=1 Tax=Salvia splendens TaxID=180675 RepID=UPI001C2788EE|nr:phosphatidylinositol N-acetylglucosaminyltransferase subunit P-like isoform X1 [Salvia splendens]
MIFLLNERIYKSSLDKYLNQTRIQRKSSQENGFSDYSSNNNKIRLRSHHIPPSIHAFSTVWLPRLHHRFRCRIFAIRAYVPDYWLLYIGIDYYPSRYWELGVPTYVMVMIVVAIVSYTSLNFLATPPPTSMKLIFDDYSEDILTGIPITDDGEPAIEPLSYMSIDQVNQMFDDLNS